MWIGYRAGYKLKLERQASNRCVGNGKRFGVETRRGTSPEIRRSQLILVRMKALPPDFWLISLVDGAKRLQLETRKARSRRFVSFFQIRSEPSYRFLTGIPGDVSYTDRLLQTSLRP